MGRTYESMMEELEVIEILSTAYDGDEFPGYENIRLSFSQLETIIRNKRSGWLDALRNQKAVYLITDTSNGKMYVGSATAQYGMLLQRWTNYIDNGHGGNVELTVVVAAITAVKKKTAMNTHIELNTDCGLKEPSMVMLEQLRTVDKATELDNFVGRITDADKISEIKRGLKFAVGIPVKPKTERKGIVLSLCPRCRSEFQSIPENIVKRLDPFQADKEMCDKCQVGYGYDYMIFKKNHHHAKGGVDNV